MTNPVQQPAGMSEVVSFLISNPAAVYIAAVIILLGTFTLYMVWFRPPILNLISILKSLSKAINQGTDDWPAVKERLSTIAKRHPMLSVAWMETEERVVALPMGEHRAYFMFGSPRDLWSPQQLLSRQINLSLAESVPNLLVGVGLLLTFFFLTIALTQATTALGVQANAQADLLQATQGLLGAAGAKFLTSLAGLLASLSWTIFYKRRIAQLSKACEDVLAALAYVAPVGGGELALMRQVDLASGTLKANEGVLRNFGDLLAFNEELLGEVREQHGTLKRFETDLAVSLANAINPQMENMTNKLVGAIEGLSNKIGTMNQEALEEMMEKYAAVLKKETDNEMVQLRETLKLLTEQLDGAGKNIGDGVAKAATAIDDASNNLVAQVSQASANLMASSVKLEEAASNIKISMDDLDTSVKDAADIGRTGADIVSIFINDAKLTVQNLGNTTKSLVETSSALKTVSGEIAEIVNNVEELSREQQAVVNAVRGATPAAMKAINEVTEVLNQSAEQTKAAFNSTKTSMLATATSLEKTVAAITEGVESYTTQVGELHRNMDGSLAKAVGSLEKGITGLEDSVEELSEIMEQATKRRP